MAALLASKPTVVWCPGLLHTQEHFQPIVSALAKVSIPSVVISVPNIGAGAATAAPYDDVKTTRTKLQELVDEGKEVLVISHSYGGVPACQAIRGLEKSQRVKDNQHGGIIRIVFMGAFVIQEGESLWTFLNGQLPPPWARRDVSRTHFSGSLLAYHSTANAFSRGTSGTLTFPKASPIFSEIVRKNLRRPGP